MIGVIVAMKSELDLNKLTIIKSESFFGVEIYYLKNNIVLIFSNIGTVNAAKATTLLICRFKDRLKMILNFGTVGTWNNNYHPLDLFMLNKFQYLDVDVTAFGYLINQLPHEQKTYEFKINSYLENYLKKLDNKKIHTLKTCGSADSFINKNNWQRFLEVQKVDVFDMEAVAIAQICYFYKIDFFSFKIISDTLNEQLDSNIQFQEHLNKIACQLTELINLLN